MNLAARGFNGLQKSSSHHLAPFSTQSTLISTFISVLTVWTRENAEVLFRILRACFIFIKISTFYTNSVWIIHREGKTCNSLNGPRKLIKGCSSKCQSILASWKTVEIILWRILTIKMKGNNFFEGQRGNSNWVQINISLFFPFLQKF